MLIDDGSGRGYRAGVDADHNLMTSGPIESMLAYYARVHASAFAWTIVSYDFDAADTILLVRNDSTTHLLCIDYAWAWMDTSGAMLLQHPTAAFTIAGTAVVGVNMNTTSTAIADATAMADETGNTQGDIINMKHHAEEMSVGVEFLARDGVVVLGYQDALGIDAVTGADECLAVMQGYFREA